MEILRTNQKDILEIRNTGTELKNAFGGLAGSLHAAEERISELEDISVEWITKSKGEKTGRKTEQNIPGR